MTLRVSVTLTREQLAFVKRAERNQEVPLARAIAEYAVAHALGQKWDGELVNVSEWRVWKRLHRDVKMIEVCLGTYSLAPLVVYKSDDDVPFVLVLGGTPPDYVLAGWMFGADAKKPAYWNDVDKCFAVPQTDLRSCTELREQTGARRGGRTRDPAPDFGGHGRWPQRRHADDGSHPSKYGNVVSSSMDVPCLRCQTMIPKGALVGGNLVTGTIHGDPAMCNMKTKNRH